MCREDREGAERKSDSYDGSAERTSDGYISRISTLSKAKAERDKEGATVNTWRHYAHILQNRDYCNTNYGGDKANYNNKRGLNRNCMACENTVLCVAGKLKNSCL